MFNKKKQVTEEEILQLYKLGYLRCNEMYRFKKPNQPINIGVFTIYIVGNGEFILDYIQNSHIYNSEEEAIKENLDKLKFAIKQCGLVSIVKAMLSVPMTLEMRIKLVEEVLESKGAKFYE